MVGSVSVTSEILEFKKTCVKCGECKPLSGFFKASRRPDKLMTECKMCIYTYREAWGKNRSKITHPNIKKKCSGCGVEKPLSNYHNDKKGRYGKTYKCSPCHTLDARSYSKRFPEKVKQARRKRLLKTYDLTQSTFDALFESQGGRCAICRKSIDISHPSTCIDHDHSTGAVRGILCTLCNSGLGKFKDNVEFMAAAIKYIQDRKM